MHRPRPTTIRLGSIALSAIFVLAACGGAGAGTTALPTPPAASPTAMAEHSAMPSEPAPASAAAPVSMGAFHGVDGTASGTVALFHKPDGTFVITFEDFAIASNAHTDVILVANKDVANDGEIDKATIVDLGPLKGTSGMQDFVVPASADAMTYHTVVLWDTQMTHAIAAAPLQ